MAEDNQKTNEDIDFTNFEEKFFEEVRNGQKYQHFLNISSQMDNMLIRSILSSINIPTYVEGENMNKFYGGATTFLINVFNIKLYILICDYDNAIEVVKEFIKNKIDSLDSKVGKDKYIKLLEILAAPYNISTSQEMLGITIFPKEDSNKKDKESLFHKLKKEFLIKNRRD